MMEALQHRVTYAARRKDFSTMFLNPVKHLSFHPCRHFAMDHTQRVERNHQLRAFMKGVNSRSNRGPHHDPNHDPTEFREHWHNFFSSSLSVSRR